MAEVVTTGGGYALKAQSEAERRLLAQGARRGGELHLDGALYRVQGEHLALPRGISQSRAQTLARELEQAARAHREAEQRRRGFKLVE